MKKRCLCAAAALLSAAILFCSCKTEESAAADTVGRFLISDGYVSEMPGETDAAMLSFAAERINFVYDTYLSDIRGKTVFAVIPDKRVFFSGTGAAAQRAYEALCTDITGLLGFSAKVFDPRPYLSLDRYYHADVHWKQETLLPLAAALCRELDVPFSEDIFQKKTHPDPFRGAYEREEPSLTALVDGDTLSYLTWEGMEDCTVTSCQNGTPSVGVLYDSAGIADGKTDSYDFFLSGADPLILITNPHGAADRTLYCFRDSFASSLLPLLLPSYREIAVIDQRYLHSELLGEYLTFSENADVLFLYSAALLSRGIVLK